MENHLKGETSPYLLQHKQNPVEWYPWCDAAFEKAKNEEKPVFLSIGYSTCHWCHVMAHECFEDVETAAVLNQNFISIKVDKEERPDIDSVYMNVCQALTGSGGWPLTVFLTPDQKPFYAGTYFPKPALIELLTNIASLWRTGRQEFLETGETLIERLNPHSISEGNLSEELMQDAEENLRHAFDQEHGGFGNAPKFPMPHNLLFLLERYTQTKDRHILHMAEKTLEQMYRGGMFDQVGFGFSRYSTDPYFLIPHFEKMLYDNALLIMSYIKAYEVTGKELYSGAAVKTADYVLREMTSPDGGFYSAQDADSDGVEGGYYAFDYDEIIELLGADAGAQFNARYGISRQGNFDGKNIPNLLAHPEDAWEYEEILPKVYEYRKARAKLHLDDKILTSWNGLMIAAFAQLYRVSDNERYLKVAEGATSYLEQNLWDGKSLYVSVRDGRRSGTGFLDDYAFYCYALLGMYEATLEERYLERAKELCCIAVEKFWDDDAAGFYLREKGADQLILKPKETYDGAVPSGNSVMAFNLVYLAQSLEDENMEDLARRQLRFMASQAQEYPAGYCFYLLALSRYLHPPVRIVCAVKDRHEEFPLGAVVRVIPGGNEEYPLCNAQTTYYICKDHSCLPPTNNLGVVL